MLQQSPEAPRRLCTPTTALHHVRFATLILCTLAITAAVVAMVAAPVLAGGSHLCVGGCPSCDEGDYATAEVAQDDSAPPCCCDPAWHADEEPAWQSPCECATAKARSLPPADVAATPDARVSVVWVPVAVVPARRLPSGRHRVIPSDVRGPPPDVATLSTVLRC